MRRIKTNPHAQSPAIFRIGNILPLIIVAFGLASVLVAFEVLPISAMILGSLPLGIIILSTLGLITLVSTLWPFIWRHFFNRELTRAPDAIEQNLAEPKREFFKPSATYSFTYDLSLYISATGFALVGIMLGLIILNPPGAIFGTMALELIQHQLLFLSAFAAFGAVVGAIIGVVYKKIALRFARPADPNDKPQVFSQQNIPFYVRVFGGIFLGVVIASFATLISLHTGGIGLTAIPFSMVALGITAFVTFFSTPILLGLERILPQRFLDWWRTEMHSDANAPRYWHQRGGNIVVFPWYGRIIMGVLTGMMLGTLLPGLGPIIFPVILGAAVWGSPLLFAALKKPLSRLKTASGFFEPTPQNPKLKRPDFDWFARLFAGAVIGASLFGAMTAGMGLPLGLGITVIIIAPVLSVAWPMIFAGLRAAGFKKGRIASPAKEQEAGPDERPLAYGAAYMRALMGVAFGTALGMGLSGVIISPLAAPLALVFSIIAFVVGPLIYSKIFNKEEVAAPVSSVTGSGIGVTAAANMSDLHQHLGLSGTVNPQMGIRLFTSGTKPGDPVTMNLNMATEEERHKAGRGV